MKARRIICFALSLLLVFTLLAGCSDSEKDAYPSKSIDGFIAWAAGGATDNVMRTIVPLAEKNLGQTIVLSNKPGGTGSIATQHVYTKPADGYTLLFNAENPPLYKVLGLGEIDYENFIPIVVLAKNVGILVVPADSPFNSYQDFVDACKADPGKINVGATGVGGLPFNSMSLVKSVEGIEYNLVSFDGDGTLQPALIGGQVDVSVIGQAAALQYISTGKLKAIGVFRNERLDALPDVPALGELNEKFKGPLASWGPFYGVFAKEGTDDAIIKTLSDAFVKAAGEATFTDFCDNLGLEKLALSGEEAVSFIKDWQSMTAWALYDAGATGDRSPADFGIAKP